MFFSHYDHKSVDELVNYNFESKQTVLLQTMHASVKLDAVVTSNLL